MRETHEKEYTIFSEPLVGGKLAYERIAKLQQQIINCVDKEQKITVNLKNTTNLSFVFLLACLHQCAAANDKKLKMLVDKNTFAKMREIKVPGTRNDGAKTKAEKAGFKLLQKDEDVIDLIDNIWSGFKKSVQLSEKLGAELKRNIGEIFNNAREHSEARHIIASWHTKKSGIYCFSCYDTGVGIPEKVNRLRTERELNKFTDKSAIMWATLKGNTTSSGQGRGLGLNLLKDFSNTNHGSVRICSGYGLYELNDGVENRIDLKYPFAGTFFEMDIKPNTDGQYYFKEEIN